MKYKWLDEYLLDKPGAEKDYKPEWGWHRYMVRGRMFAAVFSTGEVTDGRYSNHDMVNLKCDPRLAEAFREQYPDILPGYYSDKRLWVSCWTGTCPTWCCGTCAICPTGWWCPSYPNTFSGS